MKTISLTNGMNGGIAPEASGNALMAVLQCKCPRCRTGNMFEFANPWQLKHTMKMNKECKVCGQPLNIEVGFYYGSSYISYAATVGLSALSFIVWWFTLGFSLHNNNIFYWLGANSLLLLLLQPYLMRLARAGWLAIFVRYDRNWRQSKPRAPERVNAAQEGNW